MAAINQRIPNFLGGVSQQPDFIKFPGQVRTCNNAYPDVTFGLSKRAPGEFVGTLANASAGGQWFNIIRDEDEKYIVQITSGGNINVWNLANGQQQTVNVGSGSLSYLTGSPSKFGVQSIGDYTIITNPTKTVATSRTTPTFQNNYAFVSIKTVAYNAEYVVAINGSTLTPTTKYRAKSLTVVKSGTSSSSWQSSTGGIGTPPEYIGKTEFFDETSGLKGTVTVNGVNFVSDVDPNHYFAKYSVQYFAEVFVQEEGYNVTPGSSFTVNVAGINYTVTVDDTQSYQTYSDSGVGFYQSPKNPDEGTLSINNILGGLKTSITSVYPGVSVEIIGNGLFISSGSSFTIEARGGSVNDSIVVIQDTVQNISKLPENCKDGYIAKVANTEEAEADDYYVKFVADNGNAGTGAWEETAAPGITAGFNYDTMPHALVNNRNGTFTFRRLDTSDPLGNSWVDRQVGDDTTNPMPSFVGQTITNVFFYRNRLGFTTNENVVLSQPADYFNFFVNSAITISDADPIDIAASDVKPAYLNHVLPLQKGVILFSESAQFMLFTDSDQFSARTAQLKKLSSFECSPIIAPVDLGTSVMFTTGSAAHTRAFEMVIQDETVPPKLLEQTRVIPEFIPNDVSIVSNSPQTGIVTYAKAGDDTLYNYKYYDSGTQREQSAWYTWTLVGNVYHTVYTAGNFYTVTNQGGSFILSRHELLVDTNSSRSYTVGTGEVGSPLTTSRWFEAALDNMYIPSGGEISYDSTNDESSVTLPYNIINSGSDLVLVVLSGTDAGYVKPADSVSSNVAVFENINLTSVNFAIGYKYITEVELPTYYYSVQQGQYDVNGDLRIARMNFELGVSGPMEFHLSSPQIDDYIQYESGMAVDSESFNTVPSKLYKSVMVPIHRKNTKYTLTIKIPDPFTATLVSASWDGRYDTKRHVRR
jgi:hypothetical protein